MQGADLWTAIMQMPRAHKLVDFPRKVDGKPIGQVAIVVLTQEEQIQAAASTEAFTRKVIKDMPKEGDARRGYDDVYSNHMAVELLFRCCKKSEDPKSNFFPTTHAIQDHMTPDEVGVLVRAYMEVQSEIGPIMASMSDEEVEAWVKRLREAGSRVPLASLSLAALIDLAFILACRSESSPTDMPSVGSPLDDTQENLSSPEPDIAPTES